MKAKKAIVAYILVAVTMTASIPFPAGAEFQGFSFVEDTFEDNAENVDSRGLIPPQKCESGTISELDIVNDKLSIIEDTETIKRRIVDLDKILPRVTLDDIFDAEELSVLSEEQLWQLYIQSSEPPLGRDENHDPLPSYPGMIPHFDPGESVYDCIPAPEPRYSQSVTDKILVLDGMQSSSNNQESDILSFNDELAPGYSSDANMIGDNQKGGETSHSTILNTSGSMNIVSILPNSFSVFMEFPAGSNIQHRQLIVCGLFSVNSVLNYYENYYHYTSAVNVQALTNLWPGTEYHLWMYWMENGVWRSVSRTVMTTASTSTTHLSASAGKVSMSLQQSDANAFSGNNMSSWVNRLNRVSNHCNELTGITGPSMIIINPNSSNTSPYWAYITTNVNGTTVANVTWFRKWIPLQAVYVNQNNDISFGMSHEIAHAYSSSRWEFDAEAMANFIWAYALDRENCNAKIVFSDSNGLFNRNNIKEYYRTYKPYSYVNCLQSNTYHDDAMVYTLLNLKDQIGWQPFRDTFTSIRNLPTNQLPTTNFGRLKMFLTYLAQHSERDVIGLIDPQARSLYANKFGGPGSKLHYDDYMLQNMALRGSARILSLSYISFKIRSGTTSNVQTAWKAAASDWHNVCSGFQTTFRENGFSMNELYHINQSSNPISGGFDWTGTVFSSEPTWPSIYNKFNSWINTAWGSTPEWLRSVAAHEFGHVVGLDDVYSGEHLMNVNRNRNAIFTPRASDRLVAQMIWNNLDWRQ